MLTTMPVAPGDIIVLGRWAQIGGQGWWAARRPGWRRQIGSEGLLAECMGGREGRRFAACFASWWP